MKFIIAIVLFQAVSCGCSEKEFKIAKGKKASYSLSIPAHFTDSLQFKETGSTVDLEFGGPEGESIITAVKKLQPGNYLEQLTSVSDAEFVKMLNLTGHGNVIIFERKIVEVNGVRSFFAYYRSDKSYYQVLNQFINGKFIHVTCIYKYTVPDSLKPYYYRVITSLTWDEN